MTGFQITDVHSREILDSRGNPTVEVEITVDDEHRGRAIVPSGASTGTFEAHELRDGDKKQYGGKGVLTVVSNIDGIIRNEIIGMSALDQEALDRFLVQLDGTPTKERLGANALLGVSMATCRAASTALRIPLYRYIGGIEANLLPVPHMNILNGGRHAANNLQIQEFMIIPVGAESWPEALQWGSEVYQSLRTVLNRDRLLGGVGDEGGFAPDLGNNEEAFQLIERAIHNAGLVAGQDVYLAIDPAASEFYDDDIGKYRLEPNEDPMSAREVVDRYARWCAKYPIISIEDGLAENDWDGWKLMTEVLGSKIQIIGDDIFVTNIERINRGIQEKTANAVLIKLNQIGTISETLDAIRLTTQHNMNCIISHRSGETEDSFISDFAVGTSVGQLKSGAPARTDRVAKYNQLVRIHDGLSFPKCMGKTAFNRWPSPIKMLKS